MESEIQEDLLEFVHQETKCQADMGDFGEELPVLNEALLSEVITGLEGSLESPNNRAWETCGEETGVFVSFAFADGDDTTGKLEEVAKEEDTGRCPVCLRDGGGKHIYYGARVCMSCRGFFRRLCRANTTRCFDVQSQAIVRLIPPTGRHARPAGFRNASWQG